MASYELSKSHIAAFDQCPKRLWLQLHREDLVQVDPQATMRFAAGHELGGIACALNLGGVTIDLTSGVEAAIEKTQELLLAQEPSALFEATFVYDGVLVRIDIMEPDSEGGWHVVEVKSSTSRKDHHIADLATQVWVMRASGVNVRSAAIRHINNQFVLKEVGNYDGLFLTHSALVECSALVEVRHVAIAAAKATTAGPEPDLSMGPQCDSPFTCEFKEYCHQNTKQPKWPVGILPTTGRKIAAEWAARGVHELTDIPLGTFTNKLHARIHAATCTGENYHDVEGAQRATQGWAFPRTWLDFETIAFAIPRWIGSKPYEQAPFQFSAHIELSDGSTAHREFLSLDGEDPRRPCAEALISQIPTAGAVIAYNASFERNCINRLADLYPDLAPQLRAIASRLEDLLPVTKENWYHRDQMGSWSIKAVLPTIAPHLDYHSLEVQDGMAAQAAYLEAIQKGITDGRRAEIGAALRAYCGRDTTAMIVLLRHLTASD